MDMRISMDKQGDREYTCIYHYTRLFGYINTCICIQKLWNRSLHHLIYLIHYINFRKSQMLSGYGHSLPIIFSVHVHGIVWITVPNMDQIHEILWSTEHFNDSTLKGPTDGRTDHDNTLWPRRAEGIVTFYYIMLTYVLFMFYDNHALCNLPWALPFLF